MIVLGGLECEILFKNNKRNLADLVKVHIFNNKILFLYCSNYSKLIIVNLFKLNSTCNIR